MAVVKLAMTLRYASGGVTALCLVLSEPDAILHSGSNIMGFSGGAVVKKIHLPMQEMQEICVQSLDWEDPLE